MSEVATNRAPVRGSGLAAITNAAREIFAANGYAGTSIRDIAKKAGLSLSALYYWYPSKEELLVAIMKEADQDYQSRCAAALATVGDDPANRLAALVSATIEFRVERRVDANILAAEHHDLDEKHARDIQERARLATKIWSDVIEDGVRSGAFGCDSPDDARRTIIAACNAIAQWYDRRGDVSPEQLIARYVDIALRVVDNR